MLAALRGQPTDSLPWAPRLDLWYTAHKRAGTLPPQYRNASLMEITDDLGWGYHAIIPLFKDLRGPLDEAHRALGIYNLRAMPYATRLENVEFSMTTEGDKTRVVYHTPRGDLSTTFVYDEAMRRAGVSITHVAEHAIKSRDDYAAVAYLFDNAQVEPNVAGYEEFAARVGDRGIACGFVNSAGSPVHLIQRELMPMQQFFFELYDHPDELAQCAQSIGRYLERAVAVAAASSADVLMIGANYDASVTYPPFFREHIQPWLRRFADMLHPRGKFLLTHTDGENTGLLDCYLHSAVDIADSVCPAPMTKLSLKQVRDHFAGRISIMGGIPSVCLLRAVMSDRDFEPYLDEFFGNLGRGDHLILGISDTTPPAAEFDRLLHLAERVRAFGPVR
jgi:hypothetical protein